MAASPLPPQLLLVASRALQAAATPIVALLIATAGTLGGRAESAISFCNVLFVGNLCASVVVVTSFGARRIGADLRVLAPGGRLALLVFAGLAALLATLVFLALQTTTVTNVVLLARLGPVLYAVAAALLVGQRIRGTEWLGFALIGLGLLAVVTTGTGPSLNRGDLLVLLSAFVYAAVTLLSRRLLERTGLPALVFARNFLSAVVFFLIALALFGPGHFGDAFYGPLWGIMLVYALLVIVVAQFAWYRAIAVLPPASVTRWTFFTPALAVAYAFFLNGERPSAPQLVAVALVTLGILASNPGGLAPPGTSDGESSVAAA